MRHKVALHTLIHLLYANYFFIKDNLQGCFIQTFINAFVLITMVYRQIWQLYLFCNEKKPINELVCTWAVLGGAVQHWAAQEGSHAIGTARVHKSMQGKEDSGKLQIRNNVPGGRTLDYE